MLVFVYKMSSVFVEFPIGKIPIGSYYYSLSGTMHLDTLNSFY